MKRYIFLYIVLLYTNSFATTIGIASPNEVVKKSNFVAVGILKESGATVVFRVNDVLKGEQSAVGKDMVIHAVNDEIFPAAYFAKKSNGAETIFFGDLDKSGKLVPNFGPWSLWPHGIPNGVAPFGLKEPKVDSLVPLIKKILETGE